MKAKFLEEKDAGKKDTRNPEIHQDAKSNAVT